MMFAEATRQADILIVAAGQPARPATWSVRA